MINGKLIEPGKWYTEFDENGSCTAAVYDPSYRKLLGFETGDEYSDAQKTWTDSIHPEDAERLNAHLSECLGKHPEGMDYDIEYRMMTKTGYRWFHDYAHITRRTDGSVIRADGVVFDIQEGFDKTEIINHEQLRSDVLAYMNEHDDDPVELLKVFAERIRVLIDCDQVIYRDLEETRIMVNSPAIENTWSVPEEYCRQCEHFDAHHPMYKDGYTEMSNCQEGWQGIPVYHECPIKSSLTRIVYCDGEAAGYLAIHYVQKYHEFTDIERGTLEEFTRILSISLSRYEARKRAGEVSSIRKTLSRNFVLSDQFDPIMVVDPETGEYDWLMSVAQDVADNTSMMLHGENMYENVAADAASVVHEEDRARFTAFYTRENMMKIAETGEVRETENRWFIRGEDRYRWKYNKAVRMVDDDGRAFVVIGVIDTTEAKAKEEEYKAQKRLLEEQQTLAENSARFFALEDDFVSLYEVNLESGHYTSFDRNSFYQKNISDRLVSSSDFFADLITNVEILIYEEDRKIIHGILTREAIARELSENDHIDRYYRIITENGPMWLKMRVVYKDTGKKDIIVGVFSAGEEMAARQKEERLKEDLIQTNARLFALEDSFESLYDVNLETGRYDVFVKGDFYRNTVLDKLSDSQNYFSELHNDIEAVVFPEDREGLYNALSAQSLVSELSENDHFDYYYRLNTENEPIWFKARAVYKDAEKKNVIIGVFNASNDVEAKQIAEQKEQLERGMQMIGGLASEYHALYYFNIDGSFFKIYSLDGKKMPDVANMVQNGGDPTDIFFRFSASDLVHPDDRHLFSCLTVDELRRRLSDRKKFSVRFRRNFDGVFFWTEMDVIKFEDINERANEVAVGFSNRDAEIRREQAVNSAFDVLGEDIPGGQAIMRILSIAGDYYGAERCYVFEYVRNAGIINNTYEWCAEGVEPMIDRLQNVPLDTVEGWNNEFRRQGAFYMDALDSEHNTEETVAILEMQGIESLVAAPVMNGSEIVGFIGVDNPSKAKTDIGILEKASRIVFSEILKRDENGEEHVTLSKLADSFLSVFYVDLATDYIRAWKIDGQYKDKFGDIDRYSVSMERYVREGIVERDRVRCSEMTSPEYVLGQFRTKERFSIDTTGIKLGYERSIVFDYIKVSGDGTQFVLCCRDVTDTLAREKEQKDRAEEALVFTNYFLNTYVSAYYVDLKTFACQVYKRTDELEKNYPIVTDYIDSVTDYINRAVHPEDRKMLLDAVQPDAMKKALADRAEYSLLFRDISGGAEKIYRMQVIRGSDDSHAAFGFMDITSEINEQKTRQTEAEESRKLIDSIAASYDAAYAVNMKTDRFRVIRIDDTVIGADRKFKTFTDAREFFFSTLPERDRKRMREEMDYGTIRKKLANTKSYNIEYRVPVNGAMLWYEMNITSIDMANDYVAVGIVRKDLEITQRHLEDKRFGEYFALYEIDIDSGMMKIVKDSPYYGIDRSGTAVPFAPAMIQFAAGLDDEPREFFEKFAEPEYVKMQFAREDKLTYAYRSNNVGNKCWVDCTCYVTLRHDDGTPAMFTFGFSLIDSLGVYRQELQQKYAEQNAVLVSQQEQLEVARDAAESANRSKTDFLFSMSHDIRTPMNAIMGFTNMAIKHIDEKEKAIDCLEKTQKAGGMLLSLINSVLEVSRIESGNATLSEQPGDIFLCFAGIENTMREMADTKDIVLSFEFGDIRSRYVYADYSRCVRVFVNIISNAIKYTPEGGYVRVKCEQTGEADGIGTYRYTFADNGIGMSEEFQEHIFDQFSRENTATVSGIQGSGLGMSVVQSFVELMGGTVSVDSTRGEGSVFTVILPFRLQEKEEYTDPVTGELISNAAEPAGEDRHAFSGMKLLLVEDNELNREIAIELLEDEGFDVDDADDGTAAVGILKEKGPDYYDFVLMDIQMPVMNGYEATREIRKMYPGSRLPIIALSANAFAEDIQKSRDAGMDDHVAKPINVAELFGVLKKYI